MPTLTMQRIFEHQKKDWCPVERELPEHNPDTLYIGCVDARLNPDHIGIPHGNALIHRTISALVPPRGVGDDLTETLKYAIKRKGVKHLIVSGHSKCGGLCACLSGDDAKLPAVHEHLSTIREARDEIVGHEKSYNHLHSLEDESVRESIRHLLTYKEVQEALAAGTLDIHGWVIDTASHELREMDKIDHSNWQQGVAKNATFSTLETRPAPADGTIPTDTIEAVHTAHNMGLNEGDDPTKHQPEMLILGDLDARINPATHLNVPYGKALLYRDIMIPGRGVTTGKRAAIEFAVDAMKVKDVVVLGHTDNDMFAGKTPEEQTRLDHALVKERIRMLEQEPIIAHALEEGRIAVHGWLVDTHTKRISALDKTTGRFTPMREQTQAQSGSARGAHLHR